MSRLSNVQRPPSQRGLSKNFKVDEETQIDGGKGHATTPASSGAGQPGSDGGGGGTSSGAAPAIGTLAKPAVPALADGAADGAGAGAGSGWPAAVGAGGRAEASTADMPCVGVPLDWGASDALRGLVA